MNREFIYLNNNQVAVTDEKGKITKRAAEFGMRDVLVSEDKLNDLNTNISCIKDCVKIEKKSIELINKWYKVMAGFTVALAVVSPIALGIVNGLGLIGAWMALLLDQITRFTLSFTRYHQGHWTKIEV